MRIHPKYNSGRIPEGQEKSFEVRFVVKIVIFCDASESETPFSLD